MTECCAALSVIDIVQSLLLNLHYDSQLTTRSFLECVTHFGSALFRKSAGVKNESLTPAHLLVHATARPYAVRLTLTDP